MVLLTKRLFKDNEKSEELQREKEWSNAIKTRDGWACVICGSIYKPNAHHILDRSHRQYKFDLQNGVTLCTKHHKFCRFISAHNAPLAFNMWLEKYRFREWGLARMRAAEMLKCEGFVI